MLVSTLITKVRRQANMEKSKFVKDDEILEFLNEAYGDLYDIVTNSYEGYFFSEYSFTIAQNVVDYLLPSDFYKGLGIDVLIDSTPISLKRYTFADRNNRKPSIVSDYNRVDIRYSIQGLNIKLNKKPEQEYDAILYYVPAPIELVTSATPSAGQSNTIPSQVQNWEDYLKLDATIKCLIKEESDPSALIRERDEKVQLILQSLPNRDAGEPETVVDCYPIRGFYDPNYL